MSGLYVLLMVASLSDYKEFGSVALEKKEIRCGKILNTWFMDDVHGITYTGDGVTKEYATDFSSDEKLREFINSKCGKNSNL